MTLQSDEAAAPAPIDPGTQRVPDTLPPALPAPEPMRRVGFLKGLLVFWIVPQRYGPHLASDSGRRAAMAHVISLAVVFAITAYATAALDSSRWPDLFDLRVMAARACVEFLGKSAVGGWEGFVVLWAVIALPMLELAMVGLAVLLMPWCAGGDSAWSVLRRSLNNVWWSTSGLVPLAFAGMVMVINDDAMTTWLRHRAEWLVGLMLLGTMTFPTIVILRMLFTGAARYVGPAEGPAFRRRAVRCHACGYQLMGLASASACPECGRPVRESMPGGVAGNMPRSGLLSMLKLQWRIIRDSRALGEVAARDSVEGARRFWWRVYICLIAASVILLRIMAGPMTVTELAQVVAPMLLVVALVPLAVQSLVTVCGCLWGLSREGIQDLRVSAAVGFYSAPLMWPVALVVAATASLRNEGIRQWVAGMLRVQRLWPALSGDLFVTIVLGTLAAGFVLFWWLRLCRGLQDVRFAHS